MRSFGKADMFQKTKIIRFLSLSLVISVLVLDIAPVFSQDLRGITPKNIEEAKRMLGISDPPTPEYEPGIAKVESPPLPPGLSKIEEIMSISWSP